MVVDEVWNFLRRQAMLIRRHIGMKYLKKMPEMLFLGFQPKCFIPLKSPEIVLQVIVESN